MRTYLFALFSALTFSFAPLCADFEVSNYGNEDIQPPTRQSPFSLWATYDVIGKSKINKGHFKGDKIGFSELDVEASCVFYYCKEYDEGAQVSVGFNRADLNWRENPWFSQKNFNTAYFTLAGATSRLHRWYWQVQFTLNVNSEKWDLAQFGFYDLVFWGRYEYCKDIGIHVGFIAQTGLKMDLVYPIIGFDWQISPSWKLNLAVPVNVSIEYAITKNWTAALSGRVFNYRNRVGAREDSPHSLFRYRNLGAELLVKYDSSWLLANIHAGMTMAGKLRLSNYHNRHPHTYKLDSAPYVGGEVIVKF